MEEPVALEYLESLNRLINYLRLKKLFEPQNMRKNPFLHKEAEGTQRKWHSLIWEVKQEEKAWPTSVPVADVMGGARLMFQLSLH